jgi:Icc-related predicted phosphoesterase
MKVLATADLHGNLPEVPDCDLLLIAGDICPDFPSRAGKYNYPDKGAAQQAKWLEAFFLPWVDALYDRGIDVVSIWGNHDFVGESTWAKHLPVTFLTDQIYEFGGLKIYGSPWVPGLPRWAFYADQAALRSRAILTPVDTDIMLFHGPPYGVLDFVAPQFGSEHVGDDTVKEAIQIVRPKAYICGHIHEQFGRDEIDGVPIYNVSHVNEFYEPINPIVEIEV